MPKPFLVPLLFTEEAAPSTPASGQVAFYAKTDGRFYGKDDTGTEFILSAGSIVQADSAAAQTTTVTHNLGTRDVLVQVRRTSGDYDFISPYVKAASTNTVVVDFGEVVSAGAYRIIVVAAAAALIDLLYRVDADNVQTDEKLTVSFPAAHPTTATQLTLIDTTSQAANTGAGLNLRGVYTGTSTTSAGAVKANKVNGTAGNWGFHLSLYAREDGTGELTEKLQLQGTPPSSGTTSVKIEYHNGTSVTFQTVSLGAADSGGSGFKVLRVPN